MDAKERIIEEIVELLNDCPEVFCRAILENLRRELPTVKDIEAADYRDESNESILN